MNLQIQIERTDRQPIYEYMQKMDQMDLMEQIGRGLDGKIDSQNQIDRHIADDSWTGRYTHIKINGR